MFINIHLAPGRRELIVSGALSVGEKESVVPLHLRPCNLGQQLCNFVPDSYRTLLRMDKHRGRDDPAASCTIHPCTFYMGKCAHPLLEHLGLP